MLSVKVRDGESFESAFRRFKRECEKNRILSMLKQREYYEKPSEKRKQKNAKRLLATRRGTSRR
ncbi:30S ribosomal protein S21 [candidate division WOR-3 bacterium]|nr:30S ribosomal protein S21 [candidate division WOR-3 bacterium]MCK4595829.1 30S ribosomal protein S21 [candidate division WOR-3 bacterium]